MRSIVIGGVLLIVGTSIGGGMLALPIANAGPGFWQSTLLLVICWILMTFGAFFILEANLYLPRGKHMVSMAEATLGNYGLLAAWISYLFLLYTLLSAYISGSADVFNGLLGKINYHLDDWLASTIFTFLFGLVVYGGIHYVDYTNRLLMFCKLAVFSVLVIIIAPYTDTHYFQHGNMNLIPEAIMISITSFGFAMIVPNLRDYFNNDINTLKKVLIVGSLIPLFCYIAWDAVIIGALPTEGSDGLQSLMDNPRATSALAMLLSDKVKNETISAFFNFFTSICMLTAFLGVSLSLYSFLADGLKLRHTGGHGIGLFLLTFVPPLLIVIIYPGAYIHALRYGGIFCIILLLLLPALMCYFGRKHHQSEFLVPGGKVSQLAVIIAAIVLLIHEFWRIIVS